MFRIKNVSVIKRGVSTWANVQAGPPDAILGITEAFKRDTSPVKINLGVGAYRDDAGKPFVLPSVRAAENRIISAGLDKEYLPITGLASFATKAGELAYGDSLDGKPLAITQTISGTGALRLGAAFLQRFYGNKTIYLPNPTWGNHVPIFGDAGVEVKRYRYYDASSVSLDFSGLLADITAAPDNSAILLHACAHNPTGIDPTQEQWKELAELFKKKNHLAFFDMAYQGFASGSLENDAFAPRYFTKQNIPVVLTQSFAKNMGLYGERVGTLSVVTESAEEKARVESQIKILIRPLYSNPPVHGARIASEILNDSTLFSQWLGEIQDMSGRIISMRDELRATLEANSSRDWSHVTSQIGMFCYSGLTKEQVQRLADEFHVYMTLDGRISVAGITSGNVKYLGESMAKVIQ